MRFFSGFSILATRTAPTVTDIEAARERIGSYARVTPVYGSDSLSRRIGRTLLLKAENLQRTGSFKIRGENVEELWEKIQAHRSFLESSGRLDERRRRNLSREVFSVASGRARQHLEHAVADDPELRRLLDEVQGRRLDPLSAVREILEKVFRIGDDGDGTRPT